MARNGERCMHEDLDAASSSEEELVPASGGRQRTMFAAVAGLLCVAGACALGVKAMTMTPEHNLRAPLTVRALLEGHELADLATDNVMAVGGEQLAQSVGRQEVREAVARKLMNISDTIRMHLPEDHKKLELIQLSATQKDAVFKVLRHYGDSRMIALSRDVSDAVQETAKESGDEAALNRRLMEKLRPRVGELQRLGEVLFPNRNGDGMELNFENTPVTSGFKKWNVKMGMSSPQMESVSKGRRLSAEDLSSGVSVQAQTLFRSLHEVVGEDMPTAPARMLMQQQSQDSDASLMECMMKQMGDMNIPGCISCIFQNIQAVFSMVSKMMMGGR